MMSPLTGNAGTTGAGAVAAGTTGAAGPGIGLVDSGIAGRAAGAGNWAGAVFTTVAGFAGAAGNAELYGDDAGASCATGYGVVA